MIQARRASAACSRRRDCRARTGRPEHADRCRCAAATGRVSRASAWSCPAPLAPSTPMNSLSRIARSMSASTSRAPNASVTPAEFDRVHDGVSDSACATGIEFADHPILIGLAGGLGLGDADHGNLRLSGDPHQALRRRRRSPGCCRTATGEVSVEVRVGSGSDRWTR